MGGIQDKKEIQNETQTPRAPGAPGVGGVHAVHNMHTTQEMREMQQPQGTLWEEPQLQQRASEGSYGSYGSYGWSLQPNTSQTKTPHPHAYLDDTAWSEINKCSSSSYCSSLLQADFNDFLPHNNNHPNHPHHPQKFSSPSLSQENFSQNQPDCELFHEIGEFESFEAGVVQNELYPKNFMFEELNKLSNPINIELMERTIGEMNGKFIEEMAVKQIERDFQWQWLKHMENIWESGVLVGEDEILKEWEIWCFLKDEYVDKWKKERQWRQAMLGMRGMQGIANGFADGIRAVAGMQGVQMCGWCEVPIGGGDKGTDYRSVEKDYGWRV